jgi:hypothetical protein
MARQRTPTAKWEPRSGDRVKRAGSESVYVITRISDDLDFRGSLHGNKETYGS